VFERFISPKELFGPERLAAISESTARRTPDFPKPVVLSRTASGKPARVAYVASEVEAWIKGRIASCDRRQ
jgi:predicted DNA-binding transcriptional regulator AlpA